MKKNTQAQLAYNALREDLLSCRLAPGDPVRISSAVSRLGVNLSAVREALSRLDAEGLVISSNQRGFRIAPISIDDLQDLTSVRIDVEINCLKHSLRLGDLGWETNLVAAFHRLSKTATPDKNGPDATAGTYTLAHDDFHGALVAGCDSVWLLRIRDALYNQWERYRRLAVQLGRFESDVDAEHKELFEAAMARDEKRITKLIANHFNRTSSILLKAKQWCNETPTRETEAASGHTNLPHLSSYHDT
ncbi:MAG TPA: FCD domain-containing protein [Pusillimonas sp.]